MRQFLAFTICLFFIKGGVFAQQSQFEVLTTEHGIISNHIDDILVDHFGFLWLASYDGVQQWDGIKGRNFNHQPTDPNSLPDNITNCLFEDDNHNIWIGTIKGLCFYDRKSSTVKRIDLGKNQVPINQIIQINAQELLIATSDGLALLNLTTDLVTWPNKILSSCPIFSICKKNETAFWVGTFKEGIHLLNTNDFTSKALFLDATLVPQKITSILNDSQNRLWIGSLDQGLLVTDQFGKVLFSQKQLHSTNNKREEIRSIFQNKQGEVFVGIVDHPLQKFDQSSKSLLPVLVEAKNKNRHKAEGIFAMCEDQFGNFWLASHGMGIFKTNIHKNAVTHFSTKNINPKDAGASIVTSIQIDEEENVWAGTDGGGLMKIPRNGKAKVFTVSSGLSSNSIQHLSLDEDGELWIATAGGGVIRLNTKTEQITTYRRDDANRFSLPTDQVKVLLAFDSLVYIGLHGEGLAIIDKKSGKIFHHLTSDYPFDLSAPAWTNHLLMDRNKRLWIGTSYGLYQLTAKGFKIFNTNDTSAIQTDYVNMLAEDQEGVLYLVGESGGLQYFEASTQKFKKIEHPNLPETIKSVYCGSKNQIWLGTNKGIVLYNSKTKACNVFNENNGFQGSYFFHKAITADKKKKIYIGGLDGIDVFSPLSMKIPHQQLFLNFQKAELIGDERQRTYALYKDKPIEIPAEFSFVSIDFNIPNQYAAPDVKVKYRLLGLQNNWIPLEHLTRKITLNGLSFGNYTLEIQYTTDGEHWISSEQRLLLKVLPHWWQTWWFRLSAFLLSFLLVIIFWLLRTRAIRERNILLKRLVKERTAELNESNLSLLEKIDETIIQNETLDELNEAYLRQSKTILSQQNVLLTQNKDLQELVEHSGVLKNKTPQEYLKTLNEKAQQIEHHSLFKIALFQVENEGELFRLLTENFIVSVCTIPEDFANFSPDFILIDQHFTGDLFPSINHIALIRVIGEKALISKPEIIADLTFSVTELSENLLEAVELFVHKRNQIKAQFSKSEELNTTQLVLHESDQNFLDKCIGLIEKNISNPDLTSEFMQQELGFSRTILYDKIKQLTNLGVHEFIRSLRLKKSITLLREKKLTVSQVAYEVGFSSPSYYIRCFTKQFGSSPKEFIKKKS